MERICERLYSHFCLVLGSGRFHGIRLTRDALTFEWHQRRMPNLKHGLLCCPSCSRSPCCHGQVKMWVNCWLARIVPRHRKTNPGSRSAKVDRRVSPHHRALYPASSAAVPSAPRGRHSGAGGGVEAFLDSQRRLPTVVSSSEGSSHFISLTFLITVSAFSALPRAVVAAGMAQ